MFESFSEDIALKNTTFAYSPVAEKEEEHDPYAKFLTARTRFLQPKRWWRRVGWPVGALGVAIMATFVILINTAVLIWAVRSFTFRHGIADVFAGNCGKVKNMNTWIHLAINLLSTMLLSGSNYCMQILCAPTRKEIDRAHAKRKWLDIGVPSLRNLKNVARSKVALWCLLGLSSVPLHLMYNSVFFSTLAANEYRVVFANEAFIRGGPGGSYDKVRYPKLEETQALAKNWERLERGECIDAYATQFLTTRRNLVAVVSDDTTATNSSIRGVHLNRFIYNKNVPTAFNPYPWICNAPDGLSRYGFTEEERDSEYCSNKVSKVKSHATTWNVRGFDIEYCLSERVEGQCSLNFNLYIIVVVMICNAAKALTMIFIAFGIKDRPLITIGDAIHSFLNINDPTTKGMCLIDKAGIMAGKSTQDDPGIIASGNWEAVSIKYKAKLLRWSKGSSQARWLTCMWLFGSAMVGVTILLGLSISAANKHNRIKLSLKGLIDLGVGSIHPATLINGWKLPSIGGNIVVAAVLIANIPQPILSFIYLLFNSVFSGMLLGDEWSCFAHERKSLRVSDPKPGQRSSYFLQLPYRYAVPLLILSGVLHWSISQSIFIARVASFDPDGKLVDPAAISTCGYSPVAIILTMLIGVILAAFIAVLGFRRYKPGIPLAGSCSAAISAACHGRPFIDPTVPLQWGVTSEAGAQIGHCSFSDRAVGTPIEGALYAGQLERV